MKFSAGGQARADDRKAWQAGIGLKRFEFAYTDWHETSALSALYGFNIKFLRIGIGVAQNREDSAFEGRSALAHANLSIIFKPFFASYEHFNAGSSRGTANLLMGGVRMELK